MARPTAALKDVKSFWESNPLCASAIPHQLGTKDYFDYYDKLREANESVEFSEALHEYSRFGGKRVLDIGSGNGYVLSRYARAGAMVSGVDLTETAVDLCQKRFKYMNLHGDFHVANAEHLPFADQSFDCVCSMGVLHHTPNTEAAVNEAFRVLKPGGLLIVMFYHRNSALYRIRMPLLALLTGRSIVDQVNDIDGVGNPKGDVYSRDELRELLGKFRVNDMFAGYLRGHDVLPKLGKYIPNSVLNPMERWLGWFLYAKANRPA